MINNFLIKNIIINKNIIKITNLNKPTTFDKQYSLIIDFYKNTKINKYNTIIFNNIFIKTKFYKKYFYNKYNLNTNFKKFFVKKIIYIFYIFYKFYYIFVTYFSINNSFKNYNKIKNLKTYLKIFNLNKKNKLINSLKTRFNFIKYYLIFMKYSLEKLNKNKFFIQIINLNKKKNKFFFKTFNIKIYFYYFKKNFKNINLISFIKMINYFLISKDLFILNDWFVKNVEILEFRNHKKFFTFLKNFFHKNESIFLNFYNIKGFFFDIRGKVGVAGNSKKRHFYFYIGKINNSSKINKMDYMQSIIKTHTGCLGVTFILNY